MAWPATRPAKSTARVGEITPQGGTNLAAALDLGYQTALRHYQAGSINRVVLLTDGAANLGDVNPTALKQKVEAHRKQGIALDCFGIGWEGYNDDLLEALSRNGDGRYGFINTPEEAATEFAGQLAGALRVAASDVKVQVEFNPRRVTAYRQIGYAKHQLTKEQFRDNTVDAAEIGAAESGNALYVVEVNPRGEGDLATVRVRFKVPGTGDYREHEWTVPFTGNAPPLEQASPALRLAGTASAFSEWLVVESVRRRSHAPTACSASSNGVPGALRRRSAPEETRVDDPPGEERLRRREVRTRFMHPTSSTNLTTRSIRRTPTHRFMNIASSPSSRLLLLVACARDAQTAEIKDPSINGGVADGKVRLVIEGAARRTAGRQGQADLCHRRSSIRSRSTRDKLTHHARRRRSTFCRASRRSCR